jgi:hypothetical protein
MAVVRKIRNLISALLVVSLVVLGVGVASQSVASAAPECDASLFILPGGGFDLAAYLQCQNPDTTTPEVTPGGSVVIQGGGYAPFSEVLVVLCVGECDDPGDPNPDDIILGTVTTDQFGNFEWEGQLPAGIEEGEYEIEAEGLDPEGNPLVLNYEIEVVEPDNGGGDLPYTGSNTGRTVTIGAALVMLGAAAVTSTVRRRRSTTVSL